MTSMAARIALVGTFLVGSLHVIFASSVLSA